MINYPASIVRYHDIPNLNQCNIGTIQRIWYIDINQDHQYQNTESSCSQTITLLGVDGQINIVFPSDKTYQCKEEIANDKPTWTNGACDVLGYHVDDTVLKLHRMPATKFSENLQLSIGVFMIIKVHQGMVNGHILRLLKWWKTLHRP